MDPSLLSLVSSFLGENHTTTHGRAALKTTTTGRPTKTALTPKVPAKFHIIVFTKDRPWQLQQLLVSMQLQKIGGYNVTIIDLFM